MFLFRADIYLDEIKQLQPEVFNTCHEAYAKSERDLDFIRLEGQAFSKAPNISIDYAVMEKTTKAAVVSLISGWSDVGSWHAFSTASRRMPCLAISLMSSHQVVRMLG